MPIKNKSSKKLLKKGGTLIPKFINTPLNTDASNLSDLFNKIITKLGANSETLKIRIFLAKISEKIHDGKTIFDDITEIVNNYKKDGINFQSEIYNLFFNYKLFDFENERHFITIDPTIIQIMIFENDIAITDDENNDIVYSLKLIIRDTHELTLRYTTHLFPNKSKTNELEDLTNFNNFNTSLNNQYINENYDAELKDFLKKYIKFYNFYRKCYTFNDKKLIEYQLKYISILGKARFADPIIQVRTAVVTDYIMSNLLFASPSYAFISGGYKGFKDNKYGVTRSGYEISKRYNRPILTIMCAEGLHDAHEYSDAKLIYGEHWGEDSIALSQLTDGAIIIAPFGGWTYIECLTLLANQKIVGIYNDFFNILNYNQDIKSNENENSNFFKFTLTEQKNIINYNINYYLILLYLLNKPGDEDVTIKDKQQFTDCLKLGVQLLSVLKLLLADAMKYYRNTVVKIEEAIFERNTYIDNLNSLNYYETITDEIDRLKKMLEEYKISFGENIQIIIEIITNFNTLKTIIHDRVFQNLDNINKLYKRLNPRSTYQDKIPEKCDGIWIKPLFDISSNIIDISKVDIINVDLSKSVEDLRVKLDEFTVISSLKEQEGRDRKREGGDKKGKRGGTCATSGYEANLLAYINKVDINIELLLENSFFNDKLHNNIIFVFSDVMYLNIYLNENLNASSFQERIQNKIKALLENSELKDIIAKEREYEVVLSRKIDGTLDEETKSISNIIKMRQDYTFKINDDCNNYTNLIIDTSENMKDVDVDAIIADSAMKATLIEKYNKVNEVAIGKQKPIVTRSQSLRILPTKREIPPGLIKARTERQLTTKS
jgi:hypothetical protein